MPARTILLLILVNLLWALNVVVSKVAVDDLEMPPLFYAALRALLTLLVLFQLLRPLPRNWPLVAAVGLAIGGGSFAQIAQHRDGVLVRTRRTAQLLIGARIGERDAAHAGVGARAKRKSEYRSGGNQKAMRLVHDGLPGDRETQPGRMNC